MMENMKKKKSDRVKIGREENRDGTILSTNLYKKEKIVLTKSKHIQIKSI